MILRKVEKNKFVLVVKPKLVTNLCFAFTDFTENEFEPNHMNGERAIKRRLLKAKGRKKWKKFRNLQKKHE